MAVNEDRNQTDFIRRIIDADRAQNRNEGRVHTRFPPEPNGYLHIGHTKSICLNFGLAEEYGGKCNLRFDDTNPEKEEEEYVNAIKADIHWLGFDWQGREYYASDYFENLYGYAVDLIKQGKAFVDDLSFDQMREYRGTLTEPGRESPNRNRPITENLDLFARMRAGEFAEGTYTLRAKIDMAAPNLIMRDPVIYRIKHTAHHRTGDSWNIYPMYDFTHCLSDAIEHITHSICTLEFQDNRALYDWVIEQLDTPSRPHQYEFAKLLLDYTILSKRKLIRLVKAGHVRGWDDPRMPSIHGMRRRGYTPAALRDFCNRLGVTKNDTRIDMAVLENCLREDLDQRTPRVMAVLRPLKVVIENYPADQVEQLPAQNHPQDPGMGTRLLPFSREIYIEREDFMEDPPKKFYRLAPDREVRLRYAYFITCREVIRDSRNEIVGLRCTYDPQTRGGNAPDGRKVKGTIHWVSARHGVQGEVRLYDRLFTVPNPDKGGDDWEQYLNPDSEQILPDCIVEPGLREARPEDRFQFERLGYFCADRHDWSVDRPVFNRIVTLRDTWGKIQSEERR
ncbi:MAG: glutamine--tRNA ligase [Gammaproteobacteria bacterium RIFCSPLOWO2_12_FULL_52_10]|nr:MAG: glutamine--tRNA ligase [Gammaproteobacteria bacterium RIFCSPLOWO2_12_FULL_52_10]